MTTPYTIILCGGPSKRLAPLETPKPFAPFFKNGTTLFDNAYTRAKRLCPAENIFVICQEAHQGYLKNYQLKNLYLEPEARNTLPAISWMVHEISKRDSGANIIVMPSDHWIQDLESFEQDARLALEQAHHHNMVLFGKKPTHAETGFGYIETSGKTNLKSVTRFHEKPNLETATKYMNDPKLFWNLGIFCFTAQNYLKNLQ